MRAAKPEDFVNISFVKKLDQTGYIGNFYKKKSSAQEAL